MVRKLKESAAPDDLPEHVQELYRNACHGRTDEEQRVIFNVLDEHENTFSRNDNDLGLTHLAEHHIDTGDAKPVKLPPMRVPLAYADEEKNIIKQMEDQRIIRKSYSPWASSIILVVKKNGKLRPCVDYRRLNALTENKDAFPIPRVRDCLDAVAGSTLYSTFDLTSGYHQIPVNEDDIPKTAFVTKYGLYEFMTMPMGLCCSAATFQRMMEICIEWITVGYLFNIPGQYCCIWNKLHRAYAKSRAGA